MRRSQIILEIMYELKLKVPELKWLDLERGQLNNPEANYPFPKPAAFIKYGRREWKNTGKGVQHSSDARIKVTLVQENYQGTFDGAFNQESAIEMLDFPEKVYLGLQGFSGDDFSGLNRISEEEQLSDGVIVVDETTFTTKINDATKLESMMTTANPDLQVTK